MIVRNNLSALSKRLVAIVVREGSHLQLGREPTAATCHTMLRAEKLERQDRKLNMGGWI